MSTWSEVLASFDGHVHSPAADCRHDGHEFCRVCCPHDDPIEYVPAVPVDERFGWLEWAAATGVVLGLYAVVVGIVLLLVRWFG